MKRIYLNITENNTYPIMNYAVVKNTCAYPDFNRQNTVGYGTLMENYIMYLNVVNKKKTKNVLVRNYSNRLTFSLYHTYYFFC